MRKFLTVLAVLLLVIGVVAAFAPAVRAGPGPAGLNEGVFLVAAISTTNYGEVLDRVGIVSAGSPEVGLVIYTNDGRGRASISTGYLYKEWDRVLVATGIRTTKWPRSLVASAIFFNPRT